MKHRYEFIFFCLFFCVSAFPQSDGIIQCQPGSEISVPAWIAPGRPHVVAQLPCGQAVHVIDRGHFFAVSGYSSRPREYAKIQIEDKVAFVDAGYVSLSATPQRLMAKESKNFVAQKQNTAEMEEQKKWSILTRDDVRLRDEILLKPMYVHGPRTFSATLSNNSELPVSHLQLLVRLYDCSDRPKSDYSNCDIIGEAKPLVPASVPPGQTRRVMGSPLFEATPRVRGTFAWGYKVLGVRVE